MAELTREQAQAFRARWRRVNAAEIEELRQTPPEIKLAQLESLLRSVDALGWTRGLEAEEQEVRRRWQRLRQAAGV